MISFNLAVWRFSSCLDLCSRNSCYFLFVSLSALVWVLSLFSSLFALLSASLWSLDFCCVLFCFYFLFSLLCNCHPHPNCLHLSSICLAVPPHHFSSWLISSLCVYIVLSFLFPLFYFPWFVLFSLFPHACFGVFCLSCFFSVLNALFFMSCEILRLFRSFSLQLPPFGS